MYVISIRYLLVLNKSMHLFRCRLRKKNWKNPAKVLLDSQKWYDDIPIFNNYNIALQELPGPEVVTSSDQLLIFAKRWLPQMMTCLDFHEILLDGLTVVELKQKVSVFCRMLNNKSVTADVVCKQLE